MNLAYSTEQEGNFHWHFNLAFSLTANLFNFNSTYYKMVMNHSMIANVTETLESKFTNIYSSEFDN